MLSDIDQLPTLQVGDYTLQFELGEPTAQGKEVAIKELRETPERQKEAAKELARLLEGKKFSGIIFTISTGFLKYNLFAILHIQQIYHLISNYFVITNSGISTLSSG